jgi:hypothetical protein
VKKAITAVAAVAALGAVPASAGATVKGMTRCRTNYPGFVSGLFASPATGCVTARKVERYWVGHEIFPGQAVRIGGIRWSYSKWNYATSQQMNFAVAGRRWQSVTIFSLPSQ